LRPYTVQDLFVKDVWIKYNYTIVKGVDRKFSREEGTNGKKDRKLAKNTEI